MIHERKAMPGTRLSALPLLLLCATAASAATLPLKPGTYVLADTPCHDPAFAAMFTYDGRHFSYPHASACRSLILSQRGHTYRVKEICSAAGDGTAASPTSTKSTYEILSPTKVRIDAQSHAPSLLYRRCPAA